MHSTGYTIVGNKGLVGYELDQENFERAENLDIAYAEAIVDSELAQKHIQLFLDRLKKYGFQTDDQKQCFVVTQAAKENWFKAAYEKFLSAVAGITLEGFMRLDARILGNIIDDTYDAVIIDEYDTVSSLDSFIRIAENGRTYYVIEPVYDVYR